MRLRSLCLIAIGGLPIPACALDVPEEPSLANAASDSLRLKSLSDGALPAEDAAAPVWTKGRPPPTTGEIPVTGADEFGVFYYAQGFAARGSSAASGAAVIMTVHDPSLGAPEAAHSLGELAVTDSSGKQIVEVGWTVDSRRFPDDRLPHLFVFYWVDRQAGCYDLCGAFVPTALGQELVGSALTVGAEYEFVIVRQGGVFSGWAIYFGTPGSPDLMGVYVDGLWNVPFTDADILQVFGEVNDDPPPGGILGFFQQMGNGSFPTATTGARARSVRFLGDGAPAVDLLVGETHPTLYRAVKTSATSMRYGGPGRIPPIPPGD